MGADAAGAETGTLEIMTKAEVEIGTASTGPGLYSATGDGNGAAAGGAVLTSGRVLPHAVRTSEAAAVNSNNESLI
jgi:hypothetical protein